MKTIVAISDLHGHLPEIPECDILLIGGDICPLISHQLSFQKSWLETNFKLWLKDVPAKHIVGVAGNHDWIAQHEPGVMDKLPWKYLEDSGTEIEGFKIWGSPWQLHFHDWAFNSPMSWGDGSIHSDGEKFLAEKWSAIPMDTDILVMHSPPFGYGDLNADREKCGSKALLHRISEVKPSLVIFGHIHGGHGIYRVGDTALVNASIRNEGYKVVWAPTIIDVNFKKRSDAKPAE